MARTITELPLLSGQPNAADVFAVVDVSDGLTKKVTYADIASAGGGLPSNTPPLDIAEPGGEDPGVSTEYSRADHAHAIDTLTVANASVAAISIVGSGDFTGPLRLISTGLTGPIDILIKPTVPTAAKGKAVEITGGQGDTNQNGGDVLLDGGPSNGGASVVGKIKIGRATATTIESGKAAGGSTWNHEGDFIASNDVYALNGMEINGKTVATREYVDQPELRSVSGTTDTIVGDDVGHVVFYTNAGGVTADLPDLSASLIAGKAMLLTLQATGAATVITVDPGVGVTIDGSASNYVAPTGRSRVSLVSANGLAWYTGTP